MAEKAIEVEARVKDFVTTNMRAIEASLRDFDREFKTIASGTTQSTSLMSKTFDQLKGSWNVAAVAATSLIGAMGAMAIFQKTTQFVSDAHSKAQAYNTAVSQLTASLGYFSNALVEQAAQLEKTKYVHQTEILQAEQRLSNYIKEESSIKRIIPAIIDLAKAKGMDLASAANLVVTAYQRGENAATKDEASMGRLDIVFKKTGDEEKDVANITEELNKKFGK